MVLLLRLLDFFDGMFYGVDLSSFFCLFPLMIYLLCSISSSNSTSYDPSESS